MDSDLTERQTFYDRVRQFVDQHVRPRVADYKKEIDSGDRWQPLQLIEETEAQGTLGGAVEPVHAAGRLLQHVDESFEFERGAAQQPRICAVRRGNGPHPLVGRGQLLGARSGNMEVLHRYGTLEQKEEWLNPLMRGEIDRPS